MLAWKLFRKGGNPLHAATAHDTEGTPKAARWQAGDKRFLLKQGGKQAAVERAEIFQRAGFHFRRPVGIRDQGAAHGDQVELAALQAVEQFIDTGYGGAFRRSE